ncbi:glycosyltransferase family 2 protein [Rhizobium sp. BT04]|uniref:glycosyltransferase family 2 protein n=1 Tax=Rhizobium sp. BT04 TaxID=3045157 RepID=UPI0024B3CF76|nr:glycosyltransferase family 2 protein [Rhizobium sp. BT04]
MELSIITTLYKSEAHVRQFVERAISAAQASFETFEIILVDDGGPDKSASIAKELAAVDSRIVVLELSRNFGHHAAALCAIEYSRGERVFLIDSDLEVDPGKLDDFLAMMGRTGADVVYGVQQVRQGSFASRHLGQLFWKLFNAVSDVTVPNNVMTERLMTRRYVDSLVQLGDKNLFMAGMFYWPGYSQVPLPLRKEARMSASTYSFGKRARLLVQAISSFSSAPLLIIFWLGLAVLAASGVYSLGLVAHRLLSPETILSGFTFLAVLLLLSFGVNLMALGVIGLYIHRIFRQVQQRPRYIVKNMTGRK